MTSESDDSKTIWMILFWTVVVLWLVIFIQWVARGRAIDSHCRGAHGANYGTVEGATALKCWKEAQDGEEETQEP